jgi:hypothetical protein
MSTQAKASKRIRHNKRILSVTIKRMVDDSPDTSWLGEYAKNPNSEFSIDRARSLDCTANDPRNAEAKEWLDRIEYRVANSDNGQDFATEDEEQAVETLFKLREELECDCGEHGYMSRGEYRYFNPSFNYVDKDGHLGADYKDDPNGAEEVRKYVRQDYERMESLNRGHWCFIGIRAEAEIMPNVVSDGLGKWHGITQTISSGGLWGIESDSDDGHIQETIREELANLKSELLAVGFSKRAIATAFKDVQEVDA